MTISDLSIRLGVSRKTLSKIVNERGSITPDMALRLSKAFNTTPELWHASHVSDGWKTVEAIAV